MKPRDLLGKLTGRVRGTKRRQASAVKAAGAPVLLLATGAGVAFWWWTQWARGRAESEAAATPETPDARTD